MRPRPLRDRFQLFHARMAAAHMRPRPLRGRLQLFLAWMAAAHMQPQPLWGRLKLFLARMAAAQIQSRPLRGRFKLFLARMAAAHLFLEISTLPRELWREKNWAKDHAQFFLIFLIKNSIYFLLRNIPLGREMGQNYEFSIFSTIFRRGSVVDAYSESTLYRAVFFEIIYYF